MSDGPLAHAVAAAAGGCGALVLTYPLQALSMRMQMAQAQRHAEERGAPPRPAAPDPPPKLLAAVGDSSSSDSDASDGAPGDMLRRAPPGLRCLAEAGGGACRACPLAVAALLVSSQQQRRRRAPPTPPAAPASAPAADRRHTTAGGGGGARPGRWWELAGSLRFARDIVRDEGWRRLYAGLAPALQGQVLVQGVYYYFYAAFSAFAAGRRGGAAAGIAENFAVSSLAGAAACTTTNPLWVVTVRQLQNPTKGSTVALLRRIVEEEGVLALWSGLLPALVLVANPVVQYTIFERLKAALLRGRGRGAALSSRELFLLGAIGKLAATLTTYPYQLCRTILQAQQRRPAAAPGAAPQYAGARDCIRDVYRRRGVAGLYQGLNSKLWASILTSALLFVFHDRCLRLIRAAKLAG